MKLNSYSTGIHRKPHKSPTSSSSPVIVLAGNPNVGKSTIFNELTGLKQHTGNWTGKTVTNAQGTCIFNDTTYTIADIPGTYSLLAQSREEEVARDFICFGKTDAVIVVCDATCLERNLNLVLQISEITNNVIVCVNLMDEANKKSIQIDLPALSEELGVRVLGICAKDKKGLNDLMNQAEELFQSPAQTPIHTKYPDKVEEAIARLIPILNVSPHPSPRWVALRLLEGNQKLLSESEFFKKLLSDKSVRNALEKEKNRLQNELKPNSSLEDFFVEHTVHRAEHIAKKVVSFENKNYRKRDLKIDTFLTHRLTGIPIMLLLLSLVFWLTITGANYPSALLSEGLFFLEEKLISIAMKAGITPWIYNLLFCGIYRVVAWIVSVMLPPMAIFFPLFTLLEDLGYLPRIAFNLDKTFQKCCACGKQALTMCMGFGCNAAGIIGCRIIDSPRERLIAILTNSFVPCNGRFPFLTAMITMFFCIPPYDSSLWGALILTFFIVAGIFMTFVLSWLLSKTLLKGTPSAFTLELPPYRQPRITKIILRSVFDRTLFVLGRAVAVAVPAGLIIWLFANCSVGDASLLQHCCNFFNPFASWFGMDGVILMAFILGLPANEIVLPIIIMAYTASSNLTELNQLSTLKELLIANGWTWTTALCTMIFSLFHWPCSTSLITIKKETGSLRWTIAALLLPTLTGLLLCFLIATTARILM